MPAEGSEPVPGTDSDGEKPSAIKQYTARATDTWARLKAEHAWLRHVVDAYALLTRNNGSQYAAAITYFSFLALFPLLLLAVAVTGFVLASHPETQQSLFNHLTNKVPGQFGQTIKKSLQGAIDARTSIGIIGLLGVLFSGLGWISNLRAAVDGVWGRPPAKRSFVKAKIADAVVLAGLGLGIVVSLAFTVVGTSLTKQILDAASINDVPGFTWLLKVIGIALAVGGDMIIFWWVLVRLPQADVTRRISIKGALMASVGFEILKVVGTYTIANTAHSPTAGPFAGLLAVLIWIQLVARFMLFCCAWMAVVNIDWKAANAVRPADYAAGSGPAEPAGTAGVPTVRPSTVGATLVGAGAVAGAVATWAATRPRPDADRPARHRAGVRPRPPGN